jgi:hypothetical protein
MPMKRAQVSSLPVGSSLERRSWELCSPFQLPSPETPVSCISSLRFVPHLSLPLTSTSLLQPTWYLGLLLMMGVSYFLFMAGKTSPLPSSPASQYQSPERSHQLEAEEDLEMEMVSHGSDESLLDKRELGSTDTMGVPRRVATAGSGEEGQENLEFSPMHLQSKS